MLSGGGSVKNQGRQNKRVYSKEEIHKNKRRHGKNKRKESERDTDRFLF